MNWWLEVVVSMAVTGAAALIGAGALGFLLYKGFCLFWAFFLED